MMKYGMVLSASGLCVLITLSSLSWLSSGASAYNYSFQSTGRISEVTTVNIYKDIVGICNLTLGSNLGDWNDPFSDSTRLQDLAKTANLQLIRFFAQSWTTSYCTQWNSTTHTGTYEWSMLDNRLKAIFDVGADPLICIDLCESRYPTGMYIDPTVKVPGIEDFAKYTQDLAEHIHQKGWSVKYWEIFNEAYLYSFNYQNPEPSNLNTIVQIFNEAARRIHTVFPDALCGTDSCGVKGFMNYFVTHGEGVGFLSFHKYDSYGTWLNNYPQFYFSDQELLLRASIGKAGGDANQYSFFYTVNEMRDLWQANRGQKLPVIVTETNLNSYSYGADPRIQKIFGAVWYAEEIRDFVLRGVDYSCNFYFAGDDLWDGGWPTTRPTDKFGLAMVSIRNDTEGGNPPFTEFYPYTFHKLVANYIGAGDKIYQTTSTNESAVSCLSWEHNGNLNVLLIGKQDEDSRVYSSDDIYLNPVAPKQYPVNVKFDIPEGTMISIAKIERGDIVAGNIEKTTVQYNGTLNLTFNGYSLTLLSLSIPNY